MKCLLKDRLIKLKACELINYILRRLKFKLLPIQEQIKASAIKGKKILIKCL